MKTKNKIIVLDTSVLLHDKDCIEKFVGNDVYIPLIVLEELDKFKDKSGILGEYARHVNRYLDNLRNINNLSKGVYLEDFNINLKIWVGKKENKIIKNILDMSSNDNVIISSLLDIKEKNEDKKVILVTKDINLRVKCDALNIEANDYYADYKFIKSKDIYKGNKTINTTSNIIDNLYNKGEINIEKLEIEKELFENEFIVLEAENKQSILSTVNEDKIIKIKSEKEIQNISRIKPKNKEQMFALHALLSESIPLVTMTGTPGSGKTFLSLMTALRLIEQEKKKRIIFTRPIQTVGKDVGFLPGDINEKMAPWLSPIVDNFRNQFGDLTYFDLMVEKGQIDVAPLSHIRGRSFNDSIIIVDEAQNATIHELKTVITRTGKNSKIILLGDIEQVDIPYVDKFSNGLTIATEKLKKEKLTAHIHFEKGYRSELANVAASLL